MNICLLNDSFPPVIDGVANVVMNYGRILTSELGAEVVVGTPRYPDAKYDGYPYKVIPYSSFDTSELVKGYRTGNPLAMREIMQMAEFGPDIIHTHCPAASTLMARILQNETGAPIVFTYHTKFDVDIARAVGDGFLKKETVKAMVKNIEACDEVWVVSEGAGDNLKSLGYEGDVHVMNNGVDFAKGRVDADKVKEVTGGHDLPEGIPVFLFVGRIIKYKGLPLIIDALKKLSEDGIDYRMVFIGSGPDMEEMQQKVKDIGICCINEKGDASESSLPGKVIFTGPVYDRDILRAWNTRADLFLFPSVYDTNGIVVREAAACGLGSVLIKKSCAAEGITDGRNGYLIDENAESMAALLKKAAGNLDAVHDVGQHAMDEIYISWSDAVHAAYERYGIIRDMVKNKKLPVKKKQSSDYVLESAATIIKGTEHIFDIPRNIYGGMKENFEDFKVDFKEDLEEFKDRLPDGVKEFSENAREITEKTKNSVLKSMEFAGRSVKEGLDMSINGMKRE
ncbi:glycosyltransferase [Butyrivibrio sp. WCE2006]|uniref:glycosyltransferase n=1 Tax=Butyrivibrio sp. WCE2006 TaxID=1410611 RepID=UPI0006786AC8|nr:glycosyltransferase [Butyrivibrio sp. WCE2006]